MDTVAVQSNKM